MEFLTGIAVQWPMTGATTMRSMMGRLRPTNNHYVRDTNFCRRDGDCVIVVENTIFKIHRFLLANSPVFADMFQLPNGINATNLMTEDEPLELPDNVEEFRALCWALYALPMEVEDQNDPVSFKFRTVLDLLSISHKYQFDSCEQWAALLLSKHFTALTAEDGKNAFLDDESLFKNSDLETILRLFVRVRRSQLREAVERSYMRRFKLDNAPSISGSLALAEGLELRSLQASIYYHLVTTRGPFQHPFSTAYALPSNDLTKTQEHIFYRGCYSLSLYWIGLPNVCRTTELPRVLGYCPRENHATCETAWKALWFTWNLEQKLIGLSVTSGPLEKFEALLNIHDSFDQACIRNKLSSLIADLRRTLADHFLGR